jgi:hypothetical protein
METIFVKAGPRQSFGTIAIILSYMRTMQNAPVCEERCVVQKYKKC